MDNKKLYTALGILIDDALEMGIAHYSGDDETFDYILSSLISSFGHSFDEDEITAEKITKLRKVLNLQDYEYVQTENGKAN